MLALSPRVVDAVRARRRRWSLSIGPGCIHSPVIAVGCLTGRASKDLDPARHAVLGDVAGRLSTASMISSASSDGPA